MSESTEEIQGALQGSSTMRSVTVSRLMSPADANVYGNVHGGVILKMIDEAGTIMASRYCNNAPNKPANQEPAVAALARIEHMDFLLPMHIGEVAELVAEIVFTRSHSILVVVKVWAENIVKGTKRMTNKARLWYVPVSINDANKVLDAPLMTYLSEEAEEWGQQQYLRQKADRKSKLQEELERPIHHLGSVNESAEFTVSASQTCLSSIVGSNDVTYSGHCQGGFILKLMDECAGTTCCKHCHGVVVTACIEATNFHKKIPKGSLIFVHSWLTFTSARSMEVEVVVEFESRWSTGSRTREKAIDAIFIFVALDSDGKVRPIPPLKVFTEEEEERFQAGEWRYNSRKKTTESNRKHSVAMSSLESELREKGIITD